MLKKERKETRKKHIVILVISFFAMCISAVIFAIILATQNLDNFHFLWSFVESILTAIILISAIVFIFTCILLLFDIIRAVITRSISKKLSTEFRHVQIKGSKFDWHQIRILDKEKYIAEAKMDKNEAITLRISNKHGEVFNDTIGLYELVFNYNF